MSNKILIFALFAAAVNASPLVGQEKCLWGPSYWCENIKQAKECDAVQHCRTKVWTMEVKAACDVCEEVVGKVRDFLSTKKTETEMIEYFEQACTTIAGPLAPMCKKAVDQYGPIILQHMIKLMEDSQKVCESFGLCSTRAKNTVVAQLIAKSLPVQLQPRTFLAPGPVITKPIKPMGESPQCVICEFVMNELKSILDENSTKEEIEQAVDQICDYLPSTVSPECTQFVNKYGPMIISLLVEEVVPSKVCNELGLCSSGNDLKAEKHVTFVEQSNGTCEFCTEVMTYVKAVLADNATQQELLSLLKEVCNALPSQLSSECNALISEYGQAILSIIVTSDPHDLCEEFGLCPSSLKGKNVDIGVTTNRMRSGAML